MGDEGVRKGVMFTFCIYYYYFFFFLKSRKDVTWIGFGIWGILNSPGTGLLSSSSSLDPRFAKTLDRDSGSFAASFLARVAMRWESLISMDADLKS